MDTVSWKSDKRAAIGEAGCVCVCVCACVNAYIVTEREREREREKINFLPQQCHAIIQNSHVLQQ